MKNFKFGDFVFFGDNKSPFNYSAGPLDIHLNPHIDNITIIINKNNINLYDDVIEIIKIA